MQRAHALGVDVEAGLRELALEHGGLDGQDLADESQVCGEPEDGGEALGQERGLDVEAQHGEDKVVGRVVYGHGVSGCVGVVNRETVRIVLGQSTASTNNRVGYTG